MPKPLLRRTTLRHSLLAFASTTTCVKFRLMASRPLANYFDPAIALASPCALGVFVHEQLNFNF